MKFPPVILLSAFVAACGGAAGVHGSTTTGMAAPRASASAASASSATPSAPPQPPVPFAEAMSGALPLAVAADERGTIVFVAEGSGQAGSQTFRAGTLVFVRPGTRLALEGTGLGFVYRVQPLGIAFSVYEGPYFAIPPTSRDRLVWAKGKMAATQYFSDPSVYIGALEGSLSVAEHVHETSWELICAARAAGTFTLDGVAGRLTNGGCVSIPAGHKHSWTPDPGTSLWALQVYTPGGPEARFRTLAAQDSATPPMQ